MIHFTPSACVRTFDSHACHAERSIWDEDERSRFFTSLRYVQNDIIYLSHTLSGLTPAGLDNKMAGQECQALYILQLSILNARQAIDIYAWQAGFLQNLIDKVFGPPSAQTPSWAKPKENPEK